MPSIIALFLCQGALFVHHLATNYVGRHARELKELPWDLRESCPKGTQGEDASAPS